MDDIKVPTATVAVRPLRCWTEYKTDEKTGDLREEDWIEYCAPGMAHIATTTDAVKRVKRDKQGKWQALEPFYNAWKSNSEVPVDGTPLAAWPGVSTQQADVFKAHGLRTVEEIAGMNDSMIGRVPLPNLRGVKEQAQRYLDAKDNHRVEAALKEKDDQIAALKAQMDQLADMMAAKMDEGDAEPKRGPGRPRKSNDKDAE